MEVGWQVIAIALLVVLSSICYLYLRWLFNYWVGKGVVGPKPVPIFGNFKDVLFQRKSGGDFLKELYRNYPGLPFVGFYIAHTPALLIRDPEVIRHILVKDNAYFIDHYTETSMEKDPLFARGLLGLNGDRWKHIRTKISPVFTSSRLKKMFYLILECGTELKNYLTDIAKDSKPVEVKEITARSMTDVITSCFFGINSNCLSNPNAEFREFGRTIFGNTVYSSLSLTTSFFMPWLAKLLGFCFFPAATTHFLRQVIGGTIRSREESQTPRHDLIDQLVQLKKHGHIDEEEDQDKSNNVKGATIKDLCEDDLVAQAAVFFTAGFETSASTTTFTLYELALAPAIQDKLRLEVNKVIDRHQGQITYEGVQEMKFLDMVVSETLRKYATLPFVDRICLKDYTIPGTHLTIEKGTPIYITLPGLHYDPDFFPEPETFDPERFSEERKSNIVPYSYLPFGEGPRICIGMRFGLLAVKTTLVNILMQLEVHTDGATPIPLKFDPKGLTTSLKGELPLIIKKIK